MKTAFIEKEILYDGSQLRSHWILETQGLKGDAVVAFTGPCHVDLAHMVDLEDVLANKPIYSESMLHFIAEHFGSDLERTVLRQRLLISLIQQELLKKTREKNILRQGDDLFCENLKLTVSIATASPVSTLIHAGINISSRNTPVPTKGLKDFDIDPVEMAHTILKKYAEEMEGVEWARCKVRGVR